MRDKQGFRDTLEILSKRYPMLITQRQAAEILGCSVRTVARRYAGKIKLAELVRDYLV